MSDSLTQADFRRVALQLYGDSPFRGPDDPVDMTLDVVSEGRLRTAQARYIPLLEDYFSQRLTVKEGRCVCGRKLFGPLGLTGTFQWGLQHGYGHCTACAALYKYYHSIDDLRVMIPELVGIPADRASNAEEGA